MKWHDREPLNGREMNSEDIKQAWKRMHEDSSRFAGFYDGLVSVETPDQYTVVQTIDRPLASWLYRVADGEAAWITNQEFVDHKGADFGVAQDSLVGTGPFLYDREDPGSRYTYVRNPNYFEQPYPYLDEVHWFVIPGPVGPGSGLRFPADTLLRTQASPGLGAEFSRLSRT